MYLFYINFIANHYTLRVIANYVSSIFFEIIHHVTNTVTKYLNTLEIILVTPIGGD